MLPCVVRYGYILTHTKTKTRYFEYNFNYFKYAKYTKKRIKTYRFIGQIALKLCKIVVFHSLRKGITGGG